VLKILAERWKHMSAEEKRPYEEEHERNMRAYKKAEAARALDAAADVKPRGDKPQAKPAAEEEDDDDDDEEEDVAGKANAGGGESDSESATSSSGSSSSGSTTDY
jgi:membrane protein involved in colicin uptake